MTQTEPVGLPAELTIKGRGFDFDKDAERLTKAMRRVFKAMYDGKWYTLAELSKLAECPEASASAHLRGLRNPVNGGFCVESRRRYDNGLFEYRIDFSKPSNQGAPTHRARRAGAIPPGSGPQVVLAHKADAALDLAKMLYECAKRYTPKERGGFAGFSITPLEMLEIEKRAKDLGIA